ncbi:unnamed protein product [Notodromas monacha]|uniref:N-acetyllactosaminide beta-1,3-N-acetylglucosaminyltransferase n=1 Tax=Notodromas monacha TaxID=399045 RepID=A0A7R9GAW8_9CRUS|nr:unnamed protein product [Notodromas monacha]CAG0915900.1 unnamed protein product [Notodromas monacha]
MARTCHPLLRASKEKIIRCMRRQVCNPRVLFSFILALVFVYATWTVFAVQRSTYLLKNPSARNDVTLRRIRQVKPIRIPRNYSKPLPSFTPLLVNAHKPFEKLVHDAPNALIKSVATVERKRKPVPQFSPQLKENSPYKVLKNYFGPSKSIVGVNSKTNNDTVTFCTHATVNYLKFLVELTKRWRGPVSVAVYAPGEDFVLAVEIIVFLRACFPSVRAYAAFHLFYDADLTPEMDLRLSFVNVSARCAVYENHFVSRPWSLAYPVNVARNVARAGARTKHVLVADVELMPSRDFVSKFANFMSREARKNNAVMTANHRVFVLPVFEIAPGREIPETKKDLVAMINARTAFYFHSLVCPHCQRFPGISQWISSEKPSENIKVFTVARREGVFLRWEPIYIGTKKDPFFDERLTWDGLQDKMSQVLEMCLVGYKFVVLDSAFLVHRPGLRTVSYMSNDPSVKWRHPLIAYNKNITEVIHEELKAKYSGAFRRGMCHQPKA